jgi:hypothetical protein
MNTHSSPLSAHDSSRQHATSVLALHTACVLHWGHAGHGHLYPPTPAASLLGSTRGTLIMRVSSAASNLQVGFDIGVQH